MNGVDPRPWNALASALCIALALGSGAHAAPPEYRALRVVDDAGASIPGATAEIHLTTAGHTERAPLEGSVGSFRLPVSPRWLVARLGDGAGFEHANLVIRAPGFATTRSNDFVWPCVERSAAWSPAITVGSIRFANGDAIELSPTSEAAIELRPRRAHPREARFVDELGQPIAGLGVDVYELWSRPTGFEPLHIEQLITTTATDADGRIELPDTDFDLGLQIAPAPYELAGELPYSWRPRLALAKPGVARVEVHLRAWRSIAFHLSVRRRGAPVGGLELIGAERDAQQRTRSVSSDTAAGASVRTDADGRIDLAAFAPERWSWLALVDPVAPSKPLWQAMVSALDVTHPIAVELEPAPPNSAPLPEAAARGEPARSLELRFVDADGRPVAIESAEILLAAWNSVPPRVRLAHRDGRVELPISKAFVHSLWPEGLDADPRSWETVTAFLFVRANAAAPVLSDGFTWSQLAEMGTGTKLRSAIPFPSRVVTELSPTEDVQTVVMRSPRPRWIRVVDPSGHPVSGVALAASLFWSDRNHCGAPVGSEPLAEARTDGDGRIAIPDGDLKIRIDVPPGAPEWLGAPRWLTIPVPITADLSQPVPDIVLRPKAHDLLRLHVTKGGRPLAGIHLGGFVDRCPCGACGAWVAGADGSAPVSDTNGDLVITDFDWELWRELYLWPPDRRAPLWSAEPVNLGLDRTIEVALPEDPVCPWPLDDRSD